MKRILSFGLGLWALLAIAVEGGNSSGGEEVYGAGSIPHEAAQATLVGIVSTVKGTATWKISFRHLFKGTDLDIEISSRHSRFTPQADAVLFVRETQGRKWIGRVMALTPALERALQEYFDDASDPARLQWAINYAKSTDSLLSWSAKLELENLARGSSKDKVLAALIADPKVLPPMERVSLLSQFLPDLEVERELKAYAIDPKMGALRRKAANAFFHRAQQYRALIEAWKDGREGADRLLQQWAEAAWKMHFAPKPVADDSQIEQLRADLADPAKRQHAIGRAEKFRNDLRIAALLAEVVRDPSAGDINRDFALSALREHSYSQILELVLDRGLPLPTRSAAILALGMTRDQSFIEQMVLRLETEALKDQARAFLIP
jgi:hypothetical protein